MKKIGFIKQFHKITLILGILLMVICTDGTAQKKSKKSSRAARKSEALAKKRAEEEYQNRLDSINYRKALAAFEADGWAFETTQLVDNMGQPITGQTMPNIVGYNGIDMDAFVVYREKAPSIGSEEERFYYRPVHFQGQVVKKEFSKDKKGRLLFKYSVAPPFRSEVTAVLTPWTNWGTITLSGIGNIQYFGKFIPIDECWYYLEGEGSRKRNKK